MTSIALPRLMDANLREKCRVRPLKLMLEQSMTPLSRAEMTLALDEAAVAVGDFFELFDEGGSAGCYRVNSVRKELRAGGGQVLTLEHGLTTLGDSLLSGYTEVGGAGMGTGQVIAALLSHQNTAYWQFGGCEAQAAFTYAFENENLLTALLSVTAPLEGVWLWDYDMTVFPWKLYLRAASDVDACECRMNRNLRSVRVDIDRSTLCTRIYPLGYGEGVDQLNISSVNGGVGWLDADTQGAWGVVSTSYVDSGITDATLLKAAAQKLLDTLKNPVVTVTLDADDLYAMTGEPLDRIRPGRLCLLPLPDYGLTMAERVVSLRRPDVYGAPADVTITLANRGASAVDALAALSRLTAVNTLYSQGAASQYALAFADNADPEHPATLRFYVDQDAVHVNSVSVKVAMEAFRGYSKGARSGGAHTSSVVNSNAATGNTPLNLDGKSWAPDVTDSYIGITNARHSHSVVVQIPPVTIPAHTHANELGIYEGGTASSVAIAVDGNPIPDSAISGGEFDAVGYLSRDSDGRIQRGSWHTITFTPDALTRISANVYLRTFIRSLTGANL